MIRVLHPPRDHGLIRQPVGVLQIQQSGHEPRLRRWSAFPGRKEPRPFALKHLSVDQRRQFHQLMTLVDHVDQPRTKQVILFRKARTVLHG